MKIALAVPAYRQTVAVQTAYAWAQDAMTALEMGWRPLLLTVDCHGVARARNQFVEIAMKEGARLLLMMDSDTFPTPPWGGLKDMWAAMTETGAAVVGAAYPMRNGNVMCCNPVKPGEVYEADKVGTGYMLIDLVKLRDLPKPWFVYEVAADGIETTRGEDVYFCELIREHGHKLVVNYRLQMAHIEQSAIATRCEPLA